MYIALSVKPAISIYTQITVHLFIFLSSGTLFSHISADCHMHNRQQSVSMLLLALSTES